MRLKFKVSLAMLYFIVCSSVYDNDENFKLYVFNIVYTFILILRIYRQE